MKKVIVVTLIMLLIACAKEVLLMPEVIPYQDSEMETSGIDIIIGETFKFTVAGLNDNTTVTIEDYTVAELEYSDETVKIFTITANNIGKTKLVLSSKTGTRYYEIDVKGIEIVPSVIIEENNKNSLIMKINPNILNLPNCYEYYVIALVNLDNNELIGVKEMTYTELLLQQAEESNEPLFEYILKNSAKGNYKHLELTVYAVTTPLNLPKKYNYENFVTIAEEKAIISAQVDFLYDLLPYQKSK